MRAEVLSAAPQLLSGSVWGVSAYVDTPAVSLHWSRAARVEFSANYVPTPAASLQVVAGALRLQNLGTVPAQLASVQVEVAPGGGGDTNVTAPASVAADCALGPSMILSAGASIVCRFTAPYSLQRSGAVTARVLLANGAGERASKPLAFDFGQSLKRVAAGGCAIAADGFLTGGPQLLPNSTSRPAEAEAPQRICYGQSVSFGAKLGPFSSRGCGSYLVRRARAVLLYCGVGDGWRQLPSARVWCPSLCTASDGPPHRPAPVCPAR